MVTVKSIDGSHKFPCDYFQLEPYFEEFSDQNSYTTYSMEVISKEDRWKKMFTKAMKPKLPAPSHHER